MNNIQIFENPEFGQVRVFLEDGEPLFVAKDVAVLLGYENPSKAVATHCESADITKRYVAHENGVGGTYVQLIDESNLYRLIIRSNLKNAIKFQDWVVKEVLPSIRKTGSYSVKPMTQAELLLQQAKVIVDLEKRQQKQEGEIQRLTEENEEIRKDFDYLKSKTNNTPDYYSIVGYCSLKGISINLEDAKKLGKEASKICKANGLSVGSLPDPRFGRINTYPYSLLENIVNKSVKKVVRVK